MQLLSKEAQNVPDSEKIAIVVGLLPIRVFIASYIVCQLLCHEYDQSYLINMKRFNTFHD